MNFFLKNLNFSVSSVTLSRSFRFIGHLRLYSIITVVVLSLAEAFTALGLSRANLVFVVGGSFVVLGDVRVTRFLM